jgi:hypothetical protein
MAESRRRTFESPQIVPLGGVRDLTEGIETPVAEGYGGSGRYYDASKGKAAGRRKKATGRARKAATKSARTAKKSARKGARKR